MSELKESDPRFKPLHLPKEYNKATHQLDKCLAKTTWHKGKMNGPTDNQQAWRMVLKGRWRGNPPIQRPVKGILYSTVLQVPNTHGSALLREIAKVEPRMARASGYSAKLVERSGVQLGRMFDRKMERATCGRKDFQPCVLSDKKSSCKKSNVVYRATCQDCTSIGAENPGTYIGETS